MDKVLGSVLSLKYNRGKKKVRGGMREENKSVSSNDQYQKGTPEGNTGASQLCSLQPGHGSQELGAT